MDARVKQAAKALAATAIHYSGAQRLLVGVARVLAGGRRTLILAYHRVVEDFENESKRSIPGLLVSGPTIRRHIDQLWRQGFEPASLADALEVNAGLRGARRDLVVFTFDDGYRDVYEVAYPIFRSLGVPATIYLPTSYIGTEQRLPHDRLYYLLRSARQHRESSVANAGPNVLINRLMPSSPPLVSEQFGEELKSAGQNVDDILGRWPYERVLGLISQLENRLGIDSNRATGALLTWDHCRAMAPGGFTFGAHTVRHVTLHLEPPDQIESELRTSKNTIESELKRPCRDFAYPNGYYNSEVVHRLVCSGFRSAVTTEDALNCIGGDPFCLKRKTLWENHSRGFSGYSSALTACHLDDVFRLMGLVKPVRGERPLPNAVLQTPAHASASGSAEARA